MATPQEIAKWLIAEIRTNGPRRTYQSTVVAHIRKTYGEEWSYINHNGNLAIARPILAELGKLKDEFVYWDRSDQSWRILTPDQLKRIRELAERAASMRVEVAARKAAWEASHAQPPEITPDEQRCGHMARAAHGVG